MKIKKLFFAFACGSIMLTACNDDEVPSPNEGGNEPAIEVPQNVMDSFNKQYKNVSEVKWEQIKEYYVAHFNNAAVRAGETYASAAWYNAKGDFRQYDEDVQFTALKDEVKNAFNKYKEKMYADWTRDDECEKVEREGMGIIYVIEIEKGEEEREISISELGDILKDVLDDDAEDSDEVLPVEVTPELEAALKEALGDETFTILEIEEEDNLIEVDVQVGEGETAVHKDVVFTATYKLVSIEYDATAEETMALLEETHPEAYTKVVTLFEKTGVDIYNPAEGLEVETEITEYADNTYAFEIEVENDKEGEEEIEIEIHVDRDGNIKIENENPKDDNDPEGETVPETVKAAFDEAYGAETERKWEFVEGFIVAHFNKGNDESRADTEKTYSNAAWYTKEGTYCQEDEDILFDQLPEAVKTSFKEYKETLYPTWVEDECEMVVRPDMAKIYVIEIENGTEEREISFAEDGQMLKDVLDDDAAENDEILPVIVPEKLNEALKAVFPETFNEIVICEMEIEGNLYELDIKEGDVYKEVTFELQADGNFVWTSTEYELSVEEAKKEIPEASWAEVEKQIAANNIDVTQAYEIECEKTELPNDVCSYEIEIEQGDIELELLIDENGNVSEPGDDE